MRFELESSMDVLRRTPATLRVLLDAIAEPWGRGAGGPGTLSPVAGGGRRLDGEETDWIPRARIILARGPDPRFEPYDRFRHRTRNAGRSLESLLAELPQLPAAQHHQHGSRRLREAEHDQPGNHPGLGPVTLRQLLASWVVHDLGHIAQVSRVMAKQYRDEVGPWVPFMPVLTDHEAPRS